jgi:hypothetical protein
MIGDEVVRVSAEIQTFIDRYALGPGDGDGPRPLACSLAQLQSLFADSGAPSATARKRGTACCSRARFSSGP